MGLALGPLAAKVVTSSEEKPAVSRKLKRTLLRPGPEIARKGVGRKLYETLTSSFLLGNSLKDNDTNHLSYLIAQQKSQQNFRMVSAWLNDVEEKLDDLRDAVNRKLSDMATGLQRRNMMLGNTNAMGAPSLLSSKLPYN